MLAKLKGQIPKWVKSQLLVVRSHNVVVMTHRAASVWHACKLCAIGAQEGASQRRLDWWVPLNTYEEAEHVGLIRTQNSCGAEECAVP